MKLRPLSIVALVLAINLIGCGVSAPLSNTVPTTPKFLLALDGFGAGANVNVFPVDPATGALGAPVSGSAFDLGLTRAMTVSVHPNGHFVYAADGNDGSIHAWDVNETTGVPVEIAEIDQPFRQLLFFLQLWTCNHGHSQRKVPVQRQQ